MDASTIETKKADGRRSVAEPVIWAGREVVGMTFDGELVGVLTEVPIDTGVAVVGVEEDETVEVVEEEELEVVVVVEKDEAVEVVKEEELEVVVVVVVVVAIAVVLVLVLGTVVELNKWTGFVAVLDAQYWTYTANFGAR